MRSNREAPLSGNRVHTISTNDNITTNFTSILKDDSCSLWVHPSNLTGGMQDRRLSLTGALGLVFQPFVKMSTVNQKPFLYTLSAYSLGPRKENFLTCCQAPADCMIFTVDTSFPSEV
jgi:hypothetical protein